MPDIKKIKLGSTTYDIVDGTHKNIIILEDNNSATTGAWLAKTDRISAYEDGQLFIYRLPKAGSASGSSLNITGSTGSTLGSKPIYRDSSVRLTTEYPEGAQLLLYYSESIKAGGCFMVVNDSDARSSSTNTDSKIYLIGTTSQSSAGQTTYSHDTAYVSTDGCLYSGGTKVSIVGHSHDKSTSSAAPAGHTHNVVVKGTTTGNSGTAIAAATAIGVSASSSAAPGGHTHNYDKTTGVSLTANTSTATGRIKYVEDISSTPASLGGTTTFVTSIAGGSGSLKSYNASTNGTVQTSSGRVPYVHSISAGSASGTGAGSAAPHNHTHSYAKNTYSLTGSNSQHSTKYMKVTTQAASTGTVTLDQGSGSLTNTGTSTTGIKFVEAQGTLTPGTTPVEEATFAGVKTNDLVTSATTKYAHWSTGSLPELIITTQKPHKITGWNPGTTPVASAAVSHTSTASGSSSGTSGELASYSAGVLTINKTVNSGAHTHTYDKANQSVSLAPGTAPSLTYSEVSIGSASGWSAGSLPSWSINTTSTNGTAVITAVQKGDYTPGGGITLKRGTAPSLGAATTKYLLHSHVVPQLGGTTTFATNGLRSVVLSGTTTSTDGPAYVASMTNSNLSLSSGTENTTTGENSGTAVSTIGGVAYTAPTATTYYLDHAHTGASVSNTGTVTVSGGTTSATLKYLSAAPDHTATPSVTNSGTNFNAATAVAITNTGNAAPANHTHNYGSDTALTTGANSGTAIAAVTEIKASTN